MFSSSIAEINSNKLIFVFFCVLLLMFAFSRPLPAASNSPTPLEKEIAQTTNMKSRVLQSIKDHARRQASGNIPMNTGLIIDLYTPNRMGLTKEDVARVYESEYVQAKKDDENIFDSVASRFGPITLVLGILMIFGTVLKTELINFLNKILRFLYMRIAGMSLLRFFALSHYKKALRMKYGKLIVPFRPDRPLDMNDVYVPLKLFGSNDNSQLDSAQVIKDYSRLMVIGPPGSGKSMLLKHIVATYKNSDADEENDQYIPILFELHRLNSSKLTLEQHLTEELNRNDFPNADQFVLSNLQHGNFLLLFDGFDEVNSEERAPVAQSIRDMLDKYFKCRVIITCRSTIYKNEFVENVDRTLEVVEFSDNQIRNYLSTWVVVIT